MKRLIVIAAALLTLGVMSIVTADVSSASVCQSDGTGCTMAGTYPGPNALINSDYGGFRVVWTESVVQPYSSGVPLFWTVWATYTNIDSSTLSLTCPADVSGLSALQEHMTGGSGDDGTVSAYSTTCTDDPSFSTEVPPGGSAQVYTTFHNVPWPGSAVSITWYTVGTTAYVYPFASSSPSPSSSPSSSSPPPPSHQNSGKACVFNAPNGGITVNALGKHISGHVGWAYLADPATGVWEFGANEGPISLSNLFSRTWYAKGTWADVLRAFAGSWPSSGKNKSYYHSGHYYKTYRCVTVGSYHAAAAFHVVTVEHGEFYSIPNFDCLSETVKILGAYGAPIGEHLYILNPYYWAPNHYYESGYMSKFGPKHNV